MPSWPSLEAFDAECTALTTFVAQLGRADFERPTNCPPWTLHELVVHIAGSINVPAHFPPAGVAPAMTAGDYYRRPERDTVEYRTQNVDRVREHAATVPIGEAASVLRETWERASSIFAAREPNQPIDVRGKAMTVDAYLLTRLISVAAHGVDIAITLDTPRWTTPEALRAVRPVLIDLLGADPPAAWSDQDLLEIGTGRRPLTDVDGHALARLAERFPLLS